MSFWDQFWPALIATVIGAFLGFWLALQADHARERKARDAREAGLLRTAREAVNANLTLMGQLKPILAAGPPQLPSFPMDVVLLDVVCPQLVEISPNLETVIDLTKELNNFRFQLHHINRKLDRLLDLGLSPPGGPVIPAGAMRTALTLMATGIATMTIQPLEQSAQQSLLPRLNERIKVLENPWPWWWWFWTSWWWGF